MWFRANRYIWAALLAADACVAATTPTNTQVNNQPATSVYKQTVAFSGQVQTNGAGQGTPTGTVNLLEGSNTLATTVLDNRGNFTFSLDNLFVGRHTLFVSYVAGGNFGGSNSANVVQVVNAAPTTTTLTVPATTAQTNQVIAFSAMVVHSPPSSGVPAGSVAFYDGSAQMGSTALPASGPAVLSKALSLGLHSITAVFTPSNGNSIASTSQAAPLSVGNTVTITLASNPPSPAVSQSTTLVATVGGSGTVPTGSVQFLDGPTSLGTATLSAGQANIQAAFASVGAHSITLNYSGDTAFIPGTASFTINVGKVQSTVDINASSTNIVFGQAVTLTSQIGPQLGSVGAPSGQVSFFDGASPVGSATPSSGRALLTLTSLAPGKHSLTAFYAGDTNWQPAQSQPIVVSVDFAPTLTNVTLVKSFAQQATLTAQATVVPPSTGTPTGTVQFIDSISHVVLGQSSLNGGTTTATINLQGANPVAALYVGDGSFASSTSIPASVVFMINAAGTVAPAFAPDELIAIFGSNLARQVVPADGLPLPVNLGAVTLDVIDANGASRPASLSYVSPSQVNALIPTNTAFGPATLNLTTGYGLAFPIAVTITPTAPGIFTANSDGHGVPAATVLRVKADGTQVPESAISFDNTNRKWVAVPIDVSTDSVYLLMYGTGIRNIADPSAAPCLLNNTQVKPVYAGAQPSFPGLDQVNLLLPASLNGAGTVTVQLTVNGQQANPVAILVK
jgi:uncharacterized protein (TIGR03437 family)